MKLLFDPRDGTWKESDNPALIIADIISCCDVLDDFWEVVKAWANYCDEEPDET